MLDRDAEHRSNAATNRTTKSMRWIEEKLREWRAGNRFGELAVTFIFQNGEVVATRHRDEQTNK